MTLRSRVLAMIGMVFAGLVAALYFALSNILANGFARLEKWSALENVDRVLHALRADLNGTDILVGDWAGWDDAVHYVLTRNSDFERSNLTDASLAGLHHELFAIVDGRGRLVFGRLIDPEKQRTRPLTGELLQACTRDGVLSRFSSPGEHATGFLVCDGRIWAVSARPITTSQRVGRVYGALTMGRRIDPDDIQRIGATTGFGVRLHPIEQVASDRTYAAAVRAFRRGARSYLQPLNANVIAGFASVSDINGQPSLVLEVRSERDAYRQGALSLRYALASVALAAALFVLLCLWLLDRSVIRRLTDLASDLSRVNSAGDGIGRVRVDGKDELGRLARNINGVLADLERAHFIQSQMSLNASDALLLLEKATSKCQWFGQAAPMLGCSPDDLPASVGDLSRIVVEDDWEAMVGLYKESCRTGEPFRSECRIRDASGNIGVWALRGRPILNADGTLDKFLIAGTDVTERRRSEEELRASEERLSSIVETNANGILFLDNDGRITFANAAAEDILGLSREQITARRYDDPCWSVHTVNGRPVAPEDLPFATVLATDRPVVGAELMLRHPSGRNVMLSVNAGPLHDDAGSVIGVVMSFSDITVSRMLRERLSFQAFHDTLTGLPNRALFLDRLAKALQRAERGDKHVAVLFLDLDNFKTINDSLGHATGDQLLIAFAERLTRCLRAGDTAARFGGDEFAIVAEDIKSATEASEIASRVAAEMHRPFILAAREVSVSPSIGIALSRLGETDPEELLRNADAAMYEAKRKGKDRFEVFHAGLHPQSPQRVEMKDELRRALLGDEFRLFFQPRVHLSDGRIEGMEALLRWSHPERGIVPPGEFIPVAESTDMMVPIGEWVLRNACRTAKGWHDTDPDCDWTVSVNLSARQFQQRDLAEVVERTLRETGLPPGRLVLEITESAMMAEAEPSGERLRALKDLGVLLSIDDFGTGYSSLSHLKSYPLDYVKVHRAFISALSAVDDGGAIVTATVSLAHALGMRVVAGGVERSEQMTRLKRLGCDLAQGYWFARPCPAEEIGRFYGEKGKVSLLGASEG